MSDNLKRDPSSEGDCGCDGSCSLPANIERRGFLQILGAGAAAVASSGLPVVAGPFDENEYRAAIPLDKRLDASWLRSLTDRGEKEVYSDRASLERIGMPVGGFFAGTVYLSGDGRLWLWDVFNQDQEAILPREAETPDGRRKKVHGRFIRGGLNYVHPAPVTQPFEVGFEIEANGVSRSLDADGFKTIEFDGRYPIGRVSYSDDACPVSLQLEGFSPFIPLNSDDSSLPATIMSYTITNTDDKEVKVDIRGRLGNAICLHSAQKHAGQRVNRVVSDAGLAAVSCTAEPIDGEQIDSLADYGDMVIAVLGEENTRASSAKGQQAEESRSDLSESPVGEVAASMKLAAGESANISFVIAWRFPNFRSRGCGNAEVGHHYATRFDSATEVVRYVAGNFQRLADDTRLWVDTWYDSTLPYWLLDRTIANTSLLATTTCYRFADGRFWAWEGVGCCQGTCTHVWHYAQAVGRLFPEIERDTRERVDFGMALHKDGGVGHRAYVDRSIYPADDGQCGRILGVLREHQMSTDGAFLRRLWPGVKKAIEYLIRKDSNADGMIEGAQANTLDASWYGKISFLASLYLAALKAGETMAREVGDEQFASKCNQIAERGAKSILETYNGEYYIQIEDPDHSEEIGVGSGCYIDQVFGQTWAHWVGLGRLFDRETQLSALRSLYNYNFVPDNGAFREKFKTGRWYALAGDAGLIMCSWPNGGKNPNFREHWQYMYFNECMTGFEWQVAAHMIWEGIDQPDLLEKGLVVSRAIHDRYSGTLRNPYNEIECSDHYARSMASYGVFQAVCGYNCHGPKKHVEFAPRLGADQFRTAFVAAGGWGTFEQQSDEAGMTASLAVRHGVVDIQSLGLRVVKPVSTATVNGDEVDLVQDGESVTLTLSTPMSIKAGSSLEVRLS